MKQGVGLLMALAVSALAGGCTGTDIGSEYIEISEDESDLQFYGPGLAGGYRQFITGQNEQYVRQTMATYGPRRGEYPFARIYLSETPPMRHYTRVVPVEETIDHWGWFKSKTVKKGAIGATVNTIGRIDFVTATADGVACVFWLQTFGPRDDGGVGTRVLDGYYCRGQSPMISVSEAEAIVRLVGHKEYGAIEAPRGWAPAPFASRLVGEILDFGPYVPGERWLKVSEGSSAEVDERGRIRFVARTTRIPNTLGTAFGVQYVLKGAQDGQRVDVDIRVTHPEFDGRSSTQWTTRPRIGTAAYAGYRFDKEYERATGTWTIEILHEGQIVAGKTFEVISDE